MEACVWKHTVGVLKLLLENKADLFGTGELELSKNLEPVEGKWDAMIEIQWLAEALTLARLYMRPL